MKSVFCALVFVGALLTQGEVLDRQPLSFATLPDGTYVAPKSDNVVTLLDFVKSRDDLSIFASIAEQTGG